ncbi:hypothetical protein BGX29_004671 [Mortierella sp. GBA35]|nr:hypothetical protein BGX29_004671 [Mortierella sp. GBA35]
MDVEMYKSDPDLSTLETCLRQHEEQHGSRHLLKSLSIKKIMGQPFNALMDVLTACPVEFESLTLGRGYGGVKVEDRDHLPPPSEAMMSFNLTLPIRCQHTLDRLEIFRVGFPSKVLTIQFFTRLQDFTRLRCLQLSLRHLRDLISDVSDPPSPLSDGGGHDDRSIFKIGQVGAASSSKKDEQRQPSLNICFPTVRVLKVMLVWEWPEWKQEPVIEVYEARLAVAASPSLRELYLCSRSAACYLRPEFPHLSIFAV